MDKLITHQRKQLLQKVLSISGSIYLFSLFSAPSLQWKTLLRVTRASGIESGSMESSITWLVCCHLSKASSASWTSCPSWDWLSATWEPRATSRVCSSCGHFPCWNPMAYADESFNHSSNSCITPALVYVQCISHVVISFYIYFPCACCDLIQRLRSFWMPCPFMQGSSPYFSLYSSLLSFWMYPKLITRSQPIY